MSGGALVLALVSGWIGWRCYLELRGEDTFVDLHRRRFMALGGILSSVMFTLVIVGMMIPQVVLRPCG